MHGNTFTDTPELSELRPALRHHAIQSVLYSTFTDVVARLELKLAVTPAAHVSVLQRLHLQGGGRQPVQWRQNGSVQQAL